MHIAFNNHNLTTLSERPDFPRLFFLPSFPAELIFATEHTEFTENYICLFSSESSMVSVATIPNVFTNSLMLRRGYFLP